MNVYGLTSSYLVGSFSGSSPPVPITSSSNKIYVTFSSDGSGQTEGFTASISSYENYVQMISSFGFQLVSNCRISSMTINPIAIKLIFIYLVARVMFQIFVSVNDSRVLETFSTSQATICWISSSRNLKRDKVKFLSVYRVYYVSVAEFHKQLLVMEPTLAKHWIWWEYFAEPKRTSRHVCFNL